MYPYNILFLSNKVSMKECVGMLLPVIIPAVRLYNF